MLARNRKVVYAGFLLLLLVNTVYLTTNQPMFCGGTQSFGNWNRISTDSMPFLVPNQHVAESQKLNLITFGDINFIFVLPPFCFCCV